MPAPAPCPSPESPPATRPDGGSCRALAVALRRELGAGSVVLESEPLAPRTTLRVGGPADLFVEPASEAGLARVLDFCTRQALPWRMLGRGSNLLVRDGGVRGVVISLAHPAFGGIAVVDGRLHCGAGARLKQVAAEARRHALAGLEFLEGIPGSVGGALRMNAGAHQSWTFDRVERIRVMAPSGAVSEQAVADVPVAYRDCPLLHTHIALAAVFRGHPASEVEIRDRMEAFSRRRRESQPREPSAGCIFKNPPGIPAGRLVDELGLKGTAVGGARVSEVHANFLVTHGPTRACDVLALIDLIRERARQERGLELEPEVEIIGEDAGEEVVHA